MVNNIHIIDTKMFGFDQYCAAYLVEGEKIALIDTGMPSQIEAVRSGLQAHRFSIKDVSYIFVTHCEHLDHSGNVGTFLRENPRANVYIHPAGLEYLTKPEIDKVKLKERIPLVMAERFGEMEAVQHSRIKCLNNGDVFDLGNGEKLRIIFAPGHQPSGIVIFEEKNKGLFINDLVGNCLVDADVHYPLNPFRSDHQQGIKSLKKLMNLPVKFLYLGHYGISDRPKQIMARAIETLQQLIDIGIKYMGEGKPELIASEIWKMMMPELEKLRLARGEAVYEYATSEHLPSQIQFFTKYCQERFCTNK